MYYELFMHFVLVHIITFINLKCLSQPLKKGKVWRKYDYYVTCTYIRMLSEPSRYFHSLRQNISSEKSGSFPFCRSRIFYDSCLHQPVFRHTSARRIFPFHSIPWRSFAVYKLWASPNKVSVVWMKTSCSYFTKFRKYTKVLRWRRVINF